MPSLKEVRNRIRSVTSTQQITKAMKMVAAAKLRKAQDAMMQMRPYAGKLNEILSNLSSNPDILADNPYTKIRPEEKILLIIVTSDRGLCGPFNSNVLKNTVALLSDKYAEQHKNKNVTFLCIGKRGYEFFHKRYPDKVISDYAYILHGVTFEKVKEAAENAMSGFEAGLYDKIEIIYNEFKNVATQILRVEQFLPVIPQASTETKQNNDYIFEPSADLIVNELVPKSLKIKFYRAVLESNASEQGARMTAMDKATDNAGELLKELKIMYNRTRQAAITKEILEIVGGAEALAAK
ncbi:MAG: ATP synthase F1 subunit gamma [Cytophagales bacterium]|nr:ATP synthase F1 subunit gamma [Cytophagales bacterium]